MFKSLLTSVTNYILPYRCVACSELTNEQNGLCFSCFQKLNFITSPYCDICGIPFEFSLEGQVVCARCIATPPRYDKCRSLFKFDQHSKNLIHAFKYNDQTTHAKMFARLLLSRYGPEIDDVDIIVPVPMYILKRIFRNYNSAQILATEIAKLTNKPMIPGILVKRKWTKSQTGLSKLQRSQNLSGSIVIGQNYDINNKVILLVDDVKTTGTTSNLCSHILKKSGASKVNLFTISIT